MLRASMYFSYGALARPGWESLGTTFEALLAGRRTATTRFAQWPQWSEWNAVRMGDEFEVFEDKNFAGRSVRCFATSDAQRIDLAGATDRALDEWSRLEGWAPSQGRVLGRGYGEGVQIRLRLADGDDLALRRLV